MKNFPEYIECELVAISIENFDDHQNVVFRIIDHQGCEHRILAESVKYFSLEEMRLRNIIETVSLYNNFDSQKEVAEVKCKIFFLLQGRWPEANDKALQSDIVSSLSEDIAYGRMVMFEIISLYGADLLLLAQKISIGKLDNLRSNLQEP